VCSNIANSPIFGQLRQYWTGIQVKVRVYQPRRDAGVNGCTHVALAALLGAALLPGCEREPASLKALSLPPRPERIEAPRPYSAPNLPNLVMISIDTLRADRLSSYGNPRPTSPHIDRLADDGVVFENAFSHSPKTAASHMTLMTGLYPEAHRVRNRLTGREKWLGRLSADIPTLAEILGAAGYRTHGRNGGGNMHGGIGFSRGFETYSQPQEAGARGIFRSSTAPDPFFLFVHTYQVHSPYFPPERYRDLFVDPTYDGGITSSLQQLTSAGDVEFDNIHRAFWSRVDRDSDADRQHLLDLYDACIRFTDDKVGLLLDKIDALGLAETTLVVVLSDHGEEFGEHDGFEHNALWDEILRVPLIIRVPESIRPGWRAKRIAAAVGLVDVLPTLLELMGVPVPGHLQGHSLVPLVEAGAPGRPWLFAQYRLYGDIALRSGTWKLLRRRGKEQLFDLDGDPAELRDVSSSHPDMQQAGAEHIDGVLDTSRAYWALVREGESAEIDSQNRKRLEALGYLDDGSGQ
jgi:arylsulfatase A-like enzyme